MTCQQVWRLQPLDSLQKLGDYELGVIHWLIHWNLPRTTDEALLYGMFTRWQKIFCNNQVWGTTRWGRGWSERICRHINKLPHVSVWVNSLVACWLPQSKHVELSLMRQCIQELNSGVDMQYSNRYVVFREKCSVTSVRFEQFPTHMYINTLYFVVRIINRVQFLSIWLLATLFIKTQTKNLGSIQRCYGCFLLNYKLDYICILYMKYLGIVNYFS